MKIYFAADHAAFELKAALIKHVEGLGHDVEDCGAFSYDKQDDYIDFVAPCAAKVAAEEGSFGIIAGASGQGEAMAANRVPGARAVVYYGPVAHKQTDAEGNTLGLIESSRAHNNANILSLGARFMSEEEAIQAVDTFLGTAFLGGRHEERVRKLG